MSQIEKLIKKILSLSSNVSFDEVVKMLSYFGYELSNKGKTSGSRISFIHKDHPNIYLHKPHPNNIMKEYQLKQIIILSHLMN